MQDALQTLQNQTADIAPTMQKSEERHEAMQKELQAARSAFAEQTELLHGAQARAAELEAELKRCKVPTHARRGCMNYVC